MTIIITLIHSTTTTCMYTSEYECHLTYNNENNYKESQSINSLPFTVTCVHTSSWNRERKKIILRNSYARLLISSPPTLKLYYDML